MRGEIKNELGECSQGPAFLAHTVSLAKPRRVNNVATVHTGGEEVVGPCTVPQNTTANESLMPSIFCIKKDSSTGSVSGCLLRS